MDTRDKNSWKGMLKANIDNSQVKSSCYSPNFIEKTAHCDHKPRAACVYVRLLLHRHNGGLSFVYISPKVKIAASLVCCDLKILLSCPRLLSGAASPFLCRKKNKHSPLWGYSLESHHRKTLAFVLYKPCEEVYWFRSPEKQIPDINITKS